MFAGEEVAARVGVLYGAGGPERPDMAIEVVKASGGADKLLVYHGLGLPEVWFCERGRLGFDLLAADGYRTAERSARLPHLDPALIAACMTAPDQTTAMRILRERLSD